MNFRYFLPTTIDELTNGATLKSLARWGLADVLRDLTNYPEHVTLHVVTRGPSDQPGVILTPSLADGNPPDAVTYNPHGDEWAPYWPEVGGRRSEIGGTEASADVWIGWERERPPTPQGLARREQFGGLEVLDQHQQAWRVPIARSPHAVFGTLPQNFLFDESGNPTGQLKSGFATLWELSGHVWDYYAWLYSTTQHREEGAAAPAVSEPPPEHNTPWLIRQAVNVLAINYRVSPWEINALYAAGRPVLDESFVHGVLMALIQFALVRDFGKKKPEPPAASATASCSAPPSSSSTPGAAAASPATAPVAPL
jgi:hypothetical protein